MKYILLAIFTLSIACLSCRKDDDDACPDALPICLLDEFENFKVDGGCGSSISMFSSKLGHVYVFRRQICPDAFDDVYDKNCNLICQLGGFVGISNCVVDKDTIKFSDEIILWEK